MHFFEDGVKYLGHIIDKNGLQKDLSKIEAIANIVKPKNATEVKAFICMVNYNAKFFPNLATKLHPLYNLLKKIPSLCGIISAKRVSIRLKKIASDRFLAHFDPKIPVKLACDASKEGIGAVLLHMYLDSTEWPVSFTSITLSKAEKNYATIHVEALAIY